MRTRVSRYCYEMLGLKPFASPEEIKKAYRGLTLKHHPDRGGDVATMQKINSAYEILSQHKDDYDAALRRAMNPQPIVHYTFHFGNGWSYSTKSGTTW